MENQKRDIVLRVEILRKPSNHTDEDIKNKVFEYINHQPVILKDTIFYSKPRQSPNHSLYNCVESIAFCENVTPPIEFREQVDFLVFVVNENATEVESLEAGGEIVDVSNHWLMPSRDFHGLWESLIYEEGIKDSVLDFVETTMLFSASCVDSNIIACNRLVLLHGPPGTGKTSLCKAIAQKLATHMQHTYKYSHLIEINSHSLFSKWFSESGKLVQKLFTHIEELIMNESSLVIVLIDEVESIAYARDSISSNEPSDSIRVVNAVLTQLDRIRKYTNVLILTTSNLTKSIDLAFLDRADIVQFIGNPTVHAIYDIYASAFKELSKCGIITDFDSFVPYQQLITNAHSQKGNSWNLLKLAECSCGLSGRALRKIPFKAHALYLKKPRSTFEEYMEAMLEAVAKTMSDKTELNLEKSLKSMVIET